MLKTCSSALLLTDVNSFGEHIAEISAQCDVPLRVESEWNKNYRVNTEIILCGSKYLEDINVSYYPKIVLILKSTEKFQDFMQKGITKFVFNFTNDNEIIHSFLVEEQKEEVGEYIFNKGGYRFDFKRVEFFYNGQGIYLSKAHRKYLFNWLLKGQKDNNKRAYLCILRKKFGKDFLADIGTTGEQKEKKNE